MADGKALKEFKRHPDRMPGTWWPTSNNADRLEALIIRVACPECGNVFEYRASKRLARDARPHPMKCTGRKCEWKGLIKLAGWIEG